MPVLVKDKMCKHVVTVKSDETVRKAVKSMAENNIGCVVICQGDKLLGILTERDVMKKIVASGTDPNFTKVNDVMTKKLIGLDSEKTIQEAVDILGKKGIRRLPVIDKGRLVGIITMTDLLDAMRGVESEESENLRKTVKELHLTKIKLQSRIIELEEQLSKR